MTAEDPAIERRAPVQPAGGAVAYRGNRLSSEPGQVYGTVSWDEHLQAHTAYTKLYGSDQSAERIAERGGFCFAELTQFLGHKPETWRAR